MVVRARRIGALLSLAAVVACLGSATAAHAAVVPGTPAPAQAGRSTQATTGYTVAWRVQGAVLTKSFSTRAQALAFAKTLHDAVVYDAGTGYPVDTSMKHPYAVWHVNRLGALVPEGNFSTLLAAVAAATTHTDSYVQDRITGVVLWGDSGNFLVAASGSVQSYATEGDAITAARTVPQATVYAGPTLTPVWKTAYDVHASGSFIAGYGTLAGAKAYAQTLSDSDVRTASTNQVVWSSHPRYAVSVAGIVSKRFFSKADAIAYAKSLGDATVTSISSGAVVYSNVPNFLVLANGEVTATAGTESAAVALAQEQSGAIVVSRSTSQIVYAPGGPYAVYRYFTFVQSFPTAAQAVAAAKGITDAVAIQTSTDQVLFSDYPQQVQSPYGDTFTVSGGMVVDHFGTANIVLAPAPPFMMPGVTYVSNDFQHWYAVGQQGDTYVGSWENPYQTIDLERKSFLTAAEINSFLSNNAPSDSVLLGMGQYFIEAQQAYGVNAQYLVAHAIIESAWGTSYFAQNRDNLFGYEAYTNDPDAAATFRSIPYDINFQAWFVRNSYLNPTGAFFNGPDLDGMNVDYATDPYWANSIARVMSEIRPYSAQIGAEPLLPESPDRPLFRYPQGAQGLATVTMGVYSAPLDATVGDPQTLGYIARGATFSVLGDEPGWDKVVLPSGTVGYVNWNNVSLQNMVEAFGISYGNYLEIRQSPDASSAVVAQVANGAHLLLIGAAGNGWDHIKTVAGVQGYAAADELRVIH